jgi:thiol-disulfide isomerase/thioredoxin
MNRYLLAIPALVIALPAFAADFIKYRKAEFDGLLASGKPVFVHVHADWCPTCRKQISAFPTALKAIGGVTKIVVNFDEDGDFKAKYGVRNQSTLIVFKGGKEVARAVGVIDPDKIRDLASKAL